MIFSLCLPIDCLPLFFSRSLASSFPRPLVCSVSHWTHANIELCLLSYASRTRWWSKPIFMRSVSGAQIYLHTAALFYIYLCYLCFFFSQFSFFSIRFERKNIEKKLCVASKWAFQLQLSLCSYCVCVTQQQYRRAGISYGLKRYRRVGSMLVNIKYYRTNRNGKDRWKWKEKKRVWWK